MMERQARCRNIQCVYDSHWNHCLCHLLNLIILNLRWYLPSAVWLCASAWTPSLHSITIGSALWISMINQYYSIIIKYWYWNLMWELFHYGVITLIYHSVLYSAETMLFYRVWPAESRQAHAADKLQIREHSVHSVSDYSQKDYSSQISSEGHQQNRLDQQLTLLCTEEATCSFS